jgi:hypothetical protein
VCLPSRTLLAPIEHALPRRLVNAPSARIPLPSLLLHANVVLSARCLLTNAPTDTIDNNSTPRARQCRPSLYGHNTARRQSTLRPSGSCTSSYANFIPYCLSRATVDRRWFPRIIASGAVATHSGVCVEAAHQINQIKALSLSRPITCRTHWRISPCRDEEEGSAATRCRRG